MEDALAERLKKLCYRTERKSSFTLFIENLSKTTFLSSSQLAKECGVSASFITRMIKRLGYSRFTKFKSESKVIYRQKTTTYEQFSSFVSEGIKKSISKISITQDIHHLLKMQR